MVVASSMPVLADSTLDAILRLEAKIDALSKDNAALRKEVNQMRGHETRVAAVAPASRTASDVSPPSSPASSSASRAQVQAPQGAYAAYAAAYPSKAPAVTIPAIYNWTGCYAGVHVGGGWEGSTWASTGQSGAGVVGGGQAGCNVQIRQFVIGVEGEFSGSSLSDHVSDSSPGTGNERNARNIWDGAISVRSGLAFDRAFVYGKVGAIVGKFEYDRSTFSPGNSQAASGSKIFPGVLMGVGFEYALTDNWTTKFEYNYIDFGNQDVNFTQTCDPAGCVPTFTTTVKETKQIAKIGVNYKFGGY
jgi:outer membrane immunogenic protein